MLPRPVKLFFLLVALGGLFSVATAWRPAFGQGVPAKIDSLERALATATDTNRVKVLHQLTATLATSNYQQALAYAKQSLAESRRLGWRFGEAQSFEDVGRLIMREGSFGAAQRHLLDALALWQALHQPRRRATTAHYIAEVLVQTEQYDKALQWEKEALTTSRTLHDTITLVRAYLGMGYLHTQQKRYAEALPHCLNALALLQKRRGGEDKFTALALNNLADCYVQLNEPRKALLPLFKALRLARKFNTKTGEALYESTLAQAYEKLGKLDMAVYHARNAHRLAAEIEYASLLILVNNHLDTLYAQQGNYRLARRYVAENRQLETRIRQQEQEAKVAELQGRYDTQEKERNIRLLTQQNQIAQLATLQQRTLRNAAVVIAALLLAAVGVLFNRYRLRQRTVRLLDEQNREKALLLREKTLLLQEVHHRVKNNLQIVLSLLNNQLDALPDPVAAAALRESQSRVQTMALIHQNLYQSDSLARIDMRRYLAELLDAIGRAFRREEVAVVLDVAPAHLTPHTAVPLGLVVNELVTNAYKYAFAGRTGNELRVALHPDGAPGAYRLTVADNGVGLPPLDLDVVQSLGLRLAAGLLRQMHAQLAIDRAAGTCFTIRFRELAAAGFGPAAATGAAVPSAPAPL